MLTDDQVRREGALPVTCSDTPLFGDKLTDLGLPATEKKPQITKSLNLNSIKHAFTFLHLLNSFDKQFFFFVSQTQAQQCEINTSENFKWM